MKIIEKEIVKGYEAGSASLYIPILGDIFPKLFGPKMKEYNKFVIKTDNGKYEVNENYYNNCVIGKSFDVKSSRL